MAKKRGRPPTPEANSLSQITAVRLTQSERAECDRAAQRAGVKLSDWIRDRLTKAAKRESKRD
jgi:hypothetical protein